MKIILLQDVKSQGKKDDIIDVKDGYAQYLINNKLAVTYTKTSQNVLDNELKLRKEKYNEDVEKAKELKKIIESLVLKFSVKTGKMDKVFGKLSTKQITKELSNNNINIDKTCIKTTSDLNTLGMHEVIVVLHKDVSATLKVCLESIR